MSQRITITAYSTGLYATWIFIEQWRLLLDAGDGICSGLLQKTRKIHTIAVTHADRDHLAGLLQLLQLNARDGLPRVLYPADAGSFPALAAFGHKFDPQTEGQATWTPVRPGDTIRLVQPYKLRMAANSHFTDAGTKVKSLSYFVIRETRSLKPQYAALPQSDLDHVRQEHGAGELTQVAEERVLAYSGDTPVGSAETWAGHEILIHEATYLNHDDAGDQSRRRNQHSVLPEVLEMAAEAKPGVLILTHFSPRYKAPQVLEAVQRESQRLRLACPVHVVPPGEIVRDVLSQEPIWMP